MDLAAKVRTIPDWLMWSTVFHYWHAGSQAGQINTVLCSQIIDVIIGKKNETAISFRIFRNLGSASAVCSTDSEFRDGNARR